MQTLKLKHRIYSLKRPLIMGILNVTPDSFYDGGRYRTQTAILNQVEKMVSEGVDLLDIGGYSSRPGAANITESEELKRVSFALNLVKTNHPNLPISIDTFRSKVAEAALDLGADLINDISGGSLDSKMFATVARYRVPYILTHSRGNPKTMQTMTDYADLVLELISFFRSKIIELHDLGLHDIIIDPGFGFAKTIDQNFELLTQIEAFKILDKAILVGISNKSMIYKTLNTNLQNSQNGTTVLNTVAVLKGANILRVHNVKAASEVIKLTAKIK